MDKLQTCLTLKATVESAGRGLKTALAIIALAIPALSMALAAQILKAKGGLRLP